MRTLVLLVVLWCCGGISRVDAALTFHAPVLVARPFPDCTGCPTPTWITPASDGFLALGDGVIVSPWNQGLDFAASLDNGNTWNYTRLAAPSLWFAGAGSAWPGLPVGGGLAAGGAAANLGLLPGGCNATGHDKAVATACPGLKCSPTASPVVGYFRRNSSATGGLSVSSSCTTLALLPRPVLLIASHCRCAEQVRKLRSSRHCRCCLALALTTASPPRRTLCAYQMAPTSCPTR